MAYDIGDSVPLGISVKDTDGVLANAADVTLTVTLPDESVVTPGVLNPPNSTGQYAVDYVPTMAGRHQVSWITDNPSTAYSDVFDVREPARFIVSLAEIKRHMAITSTDEDEMLRGYLEAATTAIEGHRNEIIVPTVYTERVRAHREFMLYRTPVMTIQSVVDDDNVSLTVADFSVDEQTGYVHCPTYYGDLLVTYKAGYRIIPANYTLAAKIIVQHIYEAQRGYGTGSTRFGLEPSQGVFSSHSIPWRALELLGGKAPLVG